MAPLPKVKLRAVTNLPAAIRSGLGIRVDKANGVYDFHLAFDDIMQRDGIAPEKYPTTRQLFWDSASNDYVTIPYTLPTVKIVGTSSTAATIGLGVKIFSVDEALGWSAGTRIRGVSASDVTKFIEGSITSYDPSNGALQIDVDFVRGAGTVSDWLFGIAGQPATDALLSYNNLSDLADKAAALANLGGTATGEAIFTATDAVAVRAMTAGTSRTITGAGAIVASDIGKTLLAGSSSAFTMAITAATTLGNGFWCDIRNTGTALITLDPNGSETIDGKSTMTIGLNEAVRLFCDGTSFYTDASNGKLVELVRVTNPNTATVDFDFASGFPADFDEFEVHIIDVAPAVDDVYLGMRIKTGALAVQTSGYGWAARGHGPGGGTDLGSTLAGAVSDRMALSRVESGQGIGNGLGEAANIVVNFNAPAGANVKQIRYIGAYDRSDGVVQFITGAGYYGSNSVWTGIRLLMSSGNILNGSIVLYGRRK